jgi:uncharacterized Zn finger protein (UPF0148 family)
MEYKCPDCGSLIYSRKNVLCGVCGKRLPDDLLFSASERAQLERDLKELKKREQATKAADEAFLNKISGSPGERVSHHYPILGAIIRELEKGES